LVENAARMSVPAYHRLPDGSLVVAYRTGSLSLKRLHEGAGEDQPFAPGWSWWALPYDTTAAGRFPCPPLRAPSSLPTGIRFALD
jgi:hypothetical protein